MRKRQKMIGGITQNADPSNTTQSVRLIEMKVEQLRDLTEDIREFTLVPVSDVALEAAVAGAHITVETPSKAMRRYSLISLDTHPSQYVIAVKKDANSRGGSLSMHESLSIGDRLQVETPRNDFALTVAEDYLLIAGGIGITPVYAMAQQLIRDKKPFQLIYCVRSESEGAYVHELRQLCGERLVLHADAGQPDRLFDFWDLFETPGKQHVYCCGPDAMMEEIRGVSGHWPEHAIHFEDFSPVQVSRDDDRPFTVTLQKSAKTVTVPANRTILEAIREAGIATASSCESGTCGTCKCKLLGGSAEHRDQVLMDDEMNSHIMICVSRAKGDSLVLDL